MLLDAQLDGAGEPLNDHLRNHVIDVAANPRGLPVSVVQYDASEFMVRARVVHNTVEVDPNAPTLTEVREMIEEANAEAKAGEAL